MSAGILARPERTDDAVTVAVLSFETPVRTSARSAVAAFAWRALLRLKHVPTLLSDVTVFPLLMLLMFTYLFGGAMAGSTTEYLQSVLPGVLVMTVIMTTQATGIALNADIGKGIFDRFRSLPIWQPAPLVGALVTDLGRYAIGPVVILGVGVALGFRPEAGVPGLVAAVALVLLFAWCMSWVWTTVGLYARGAESVTFLGIVVTFPLSFVSNVFVDPATLPSGLRTFVDVNPVTHLVSAVRGLMHGGAVAADIAWVLVTCGVLVAVFGPLTMRLYRRER
jgi:ABC-2 type transport system permease protein